MARCMYTISLNIGTNQVYCTRSKISKRQQLRRTLGRVSRFYLAYLGHLSLLKQPVDSVPIAKVMRSSLALTFVRLAIIITTVSAQNPSPTGNSTLSERLVVIFSPISPAARALFPVSIRGLETPLIIRITYLFALSRYEIGAACHPTALSFFGVKDKIPRRFCKSLPRLIIFSYINYRINEQQIPQQAVPYGLYLAEQGLTPFSRSTDTRTEIGWANVIAARANRYLSADGWNSLGDLSRNDFRRPYFDYTGYRPVNPAEVPSDELPRPLRWQPLTVYAGFTGNFKSQVHVAPQLARVKPLVLSKADILRRRAANPYKTSNRRKTIGKVDKARLNGFIKEYFRASRELTVPQRFAALWWDNKFFSLGTFLLYYSRVLKMDAFTEEFLFLAEMVAQHDALIVAWKEKLRHDLVRPPTIIRRLMSGKQVKAFVSEEIGVRKIDAGEFEPYVPIQPHSEFPSASAVLCSATMEYLKIGLERFVGEGVKLPNFFLSAPPGRFFTFPFTETVTVNLTLDEAVTDCAQSRLYAGVHFSPSIKAGVELGRGIGRKSIDQMAALVAGRVPDDCWRCKDV